MKAITGAKILSMAGKTIEKGDIIIEGSKIKKIGEDLDLNSCQEIINASGKIIIPGMIDAHTHLGIGEEDIGWEGRDYNEETDPVTPHLRAIDAINPADTGFTDAYKNGVTTVMIAPGSANVIGGECTALKTYGKTVDEMVLKQTIGIKAALGENPKNVYGEQDKAPSTRMAIAALMRETLYETLDYLDEKNEAARKNEAFKRDMKFESMTRVIKGEIPLRVHAHRADDIATIIRIANEFKIDITIEHCTEGHLIVDEIRKTNFPCMVGPSFGGRTKIELKNMSFATAGILAKAGIKVAIISDHNVTPTQYLPFYAALCIKSGMKEYEALKAITINAAKILGVDDRVGSLEAGKDADLVIFSGDPLDIRSNVEMVFINGKTAFSR